LKLLIVEDEPFIALDLEEVVKALGHQVIGVADSKSSAIELAQNHMCEGAFIDIKLKDGYTGIEVAQTLRGDFHLPIAFVTGNAEQLPKDRCGAVGVVEKPFTDDQIAALLKALSSPE
jgi:CheY-like chemotaxis protein